MKAKTFSIPIDNIGRVKERLAKLERTAKRLNLEFPLVEYSEPYKTQHRDSITGENFIVGGKIVHSLVKASTAPFPTAGGALLDNSITNIQKSS